MIWGFQEDVRNANWDGKETEAVTLTCSHTGSKCTDDVFSYPIVHKPAC